LYFNRNARRIQFMYINEAARKRKIGWVVLLSYFAFVIIFSVVTINIT
jgi:hypothetical protein